MHFRSIRFKTTLLYSGILLAILIVYNSILFLSVRSILIKDIDEDLEIKAGEIVSVFRVYENMKNVSAHPLNVLETLLQRHGIIPDKKIIIDDLWRSEFKTLKLNKDYIHILTVSGKVLIQSNNVTPRVHQLVAKRFGLSKDKVYFGNIIAGPLRLRAMNMPFNYKHNLPLVIQVITPLDSADRFLLKLGAVSSLCIILIVLLTSFLGRFFVKRVLVPVVTVTKAANGISHKDLSTRISGPYVDIEMKQLIDSFNGMLGRLEQSFIHINEFNSYVSHELKTPLAIVKGELELAIEQARDEETRKALSDCLEETDRMIRIIKDLLLLAKLDYKPQILTFQNIDVKAFFGEIAEHAAILVSEKQIALVTDYPKEKLTIQGDKVHLRRLFLNLLNNAIKYTPPHGKVGLLVRREKDDVYVDITDTGEGIAAKDLGKVFDKFFRADRGGKAPEPGFGLGLSIALSIARAHQGDIRVKSKVGEGTVFTIILPLSS